ncbi:hypothetical protein P3X46_020720 [Hevea brasiliensis]|uniref:Late embryogenesis abundant protein LEA-2 subgroup domain-containing protein n=1 Tax=Hevea brasiliensis TaxID=3981 RepID=A0ABQ9LF66_HEVBR|nr:hypothetical protein P3X46_020720 [Hevea brasiliensis]
MRLGVGWILLGIILCFSLMSSNVSAGKAACPDPLFWECYGILHTCPVGYPRLCEIDCKLCEPYCACDRPGVVCQDPRFIGGDGIMFYFHGKKDKDFCLASDPQIHINAHFISKKSGKGRDFTWVQSTKVLFGSYQLYIGAQKVAKWEESIVNILIQVNEEHAMVPTGEGQIWWSLETGLVIQRQAEMNKVRVKVEGLFEIITHMLPITMEESRVHGYHVEEDDCFAHLELNFKFHGLSKMVDGVLG